MAGVTFTVDLDPALLADAAAVLDRLGTGFLPQLAQDIGAMIERQTKDRIQTEKTAPDGTPWAPWSDRYAATRNTGNRRAHSLLIDSENLLESIQDYTTGTTVTVGSQTPYSAIHQFGGRGIPARPYLGLSDANRRDIEDLVIDLAAGWLQ
ncbi:MAG: phage virion morphogenesis protein [Rhodobacter sp.]|nr:phage virion morphogenesis protein [Rhodobacter sp.]